MEIFRTFVSRSFSVDAMFNFSGKANTSIHGLGEDDTSTSSDATSKKTNDDYDLFSIVYDQPVNECM